MASGFLEDVSAKDGRKLQLVQDREGQAFLERISLTRETRLLFDNILTDPDVVRLLSAHPRILSPIDIVADEAKLSGEVRGPLVRFLPVPVLFDLHGEQPLSEDDVIMAAASASVDARILWSSIERRIRPWIQQYAASIPPELVARPDQENVEDRSASGPIQASPVARNPLEGLDTIEALNLMARTAANIAGGEALPLLKALPLLPLGVLSKIGIRHRARVVEECGLTAESYTKALRSLGSAHVAQVGFSMYCCPRHRDYPYAFIAFGQSAPPSVTCAVCAGPLPGLSSYHFEPVTHALLARPGGILEPLVWRILESERIPFSPGARLQEEPECEFDAIFSSKEGGYGVVECKTWQRRTSGETIREQVRQALSQLDNNVSILGTRGVQVDHAILVSNRYEANQRQVVKSIIEERGFKALVSTETTHLSMEEIGKLKDMGRSASKLARP